MSVTVNIPQGAAGRGADAFGANPLVVPQGATVTWVNNDSVPHTATSNNGVWDSGLLNPGQSFSFTFNDAGSFPYFCAVHPNMTGMIQVNAAGASPTPAAPGGPGATPSPTESPGVTPTPSPTESPSPSPTSSPGQGQPGTPKQGT